MPHTVRRSLGFGAAAAVALTLVGAGAGAAVSAPHARAGHASMPSLKVTISKKHFTVHGQTTFQAGRIKLSLKAVGGERIVGVASLKKGFTFAKVRADLAAFGAKAGSGPNGSTPKSALKHLDQVVRRVNLYGGIDALPGQHLTATVVLPRAGTYLIFNDSGNLPKQPVKLTVTGPEAHRAAPHSLATVTALTTRRFGGPTTLPHEGTITFRNKSTESPHFLDMLHVKAGTTRKDVLEALMSNGPPSFALPGQLGTDPVGEGNAQTISYNLPKGEYIEICFFPDPKTGMPHAFMGMVRVVHLT